MNTETKKTQLVAITPAAAIDIMANSRNPGLALDHINDHVGEAVFQLTVHGERAPSEAVIELRADGTWLARITAPLSAVLVVLAAFLGAPDAQAASGPCTAPTPACAAQLPPPKPKAQPKSDINYDFMKAKKREAFLTLYAETAACMREGSVAMLRYGSRDSDYIRLFTVQTCGHGFYEWLQSEEGYSDRKAATLLDSMSGKALDAALRGPDAIIVR